MVKLQQATGMRPSEVCCLRPIDVDRRSDVWIYHPTEHKAQHHNKSRSVLLGPKAQEILRPYLLRPEREYCFRPDRHVAVPISQKRYRKDSYRRAIARACDRAFPAPKGTKDVEAWRREHRWAPNQLRHSFATYARETHGLEVAQILLGHARCDTTQVYAQASVAKGVEAARAIC
jgi:integrase